MKIELLKPFGPKILKTYITDDMINCINEHIKIIDFVDYSKRLVGRNEIQAQIDNEFLQIIGFEKLVVELTKKYIEGFVINGNQYHDSNMDIRLYDAWYNDCKEMDYHVAHVHGAKFTGIVYLEVPPNLQENTYDGQTHFIYGQELPFINSTFEVTPELGMLLLFPSSLMHLAWPTRVKENRRTMSFNLV
jgi:hypothetical protein